MKKDEMMRRFGAYAEAFKKLSKNAGSMSCGSITGKERIREKA